MTTEEYEWPNSIVLSLTTEFGVRKENPAKWFYDESDLEPAYQELMKLRPDPVFATVTGRLDARDPRLLKKEYWSADGRPIGFGDQGYFPARLVIYEITDISNKK